MRIGTERLETSCEPIMKAPMLMLNTNSRGTFFIDASHSTRYHSHQNVIDIFSRTSQHSLSLRVTFFLH